MRPFGASSSWLFRTAQGKAHQLLRRPGSTRLESLLSTVRKNEGASVHGCEALALPGAANDVAKHEQGRNRARSAQDDSFFCFEKRFETAQASFDASSLHRHGRRPALALPGPAPPTPLHGRPRSPSQADTSCGSHRAGFRAWTPSRTQTATPRRRSLRLIHRPLPPQAALCLTRGMIKGAWRMSPATQLPMRLWHRQPLQQPEYPRSRQPLIRCTLRPGGRL